MSAIARKKPPQTTRRQSGVSTRRGRVVADELGEREGRRQAEHVAHHHEGAVEVAPRQPGEADRAERAAAKNETQTCVFQALVSWRIEVGLHGVLQRGRGEEAGASCGPCATLRHRSQERGRRCTARRARRYRCRLGIDLVAASTDAPLVHRRLHAHAPRTFALAAPNPLAARLAADRCVGAAALAGCGGGGGDSGSPGTPPVLPAPGVDGPAWWNFGRDAQHAANSADRDAGPEPDRLVDAGRPGAAVHRQRLAAHPLRLAGRSPRTTPCVVPVKTGAAGGFRVEARVGRQRRPDLDAPTRLRAAAAQLGAELQPRADHGQAPLPPGAGGKLFVKDDADAAAGALHAAVFYGAAAYNASRAAPSTRRVFINTPLTVDAQRQRLLRLPGHRRRTRPGLSSGIARVDADGIGSWVVGRDRRRRRGDHQGRDEQRAGAVAPTGRRSTSPSTTGRRPACIRAATCSPSTARTLAAEGPRRC